MTTRRKPTVRRGPAGQYEGVDEAIVEFSDGESGGLISIRRNPITDQLMVEVYRTDPDVLVRGDQVQPTRTPR